MAEPLRHRRTKEAATDMLYLTPPRHISTLPKAPFWRSVGYSRSTPINRHSQGPAACLRQANRHNPRFDHLVGAGAIYSVTSSHRPPLRYRATASRWVSTPDRCETGRPLHRAADQFRDGDQSEDRESARSRISARLAWSCRRDDRLERRLAFLASRHFRCPRAFQHLTQWA